MSSFTTSITLIFYLPRFLCFLFPDNSTLSILLPIYPAYFLRTCPYHLSLASRVFSPNSPTCAVPRVYSFLSLSIIVTHENRNLLSTLPPPPLPPVFFVSTAVSNPFTIAGLTATLYTFPFTLAGTRLSQMTPGILLHPFHPACTLFFTSLPHSPLLCTVVNIVYLSVFPQLCFRPFAEYVWPYNTHVCEFCHNMSWRVIVCI